MTGAAVGLSCVLYLFLIVLEFCIFYNFSCIFYLSPQFLYLASCIFYNSCISHLVSFTILVSRILYLLQFLYLVSCIFHNNFCFLYLLQPFLYLVYLKPNSHQTIFPTDYHRLAPNFWSVVVGRYFRKKIGGCDMVVGLVVDDRIFFFGVGRLHHRFSSPIRHRQLSSMFDKIGAK